MVLYCLRNDDWKKKSLNAFSPYVRLLKNIFNLSLVESVDAEPSDIQGWLYFSFPLVQKPESFWWSV